MCREVLRALTYALLCLLLAGTTAAEPVLQYVSGFRTAHDAAIAFGQQYAPQGARTQQEYVTGIIRLGENDFGYTEPHAGARGENVVGIGDYHVNLRQSFGRRYIALAHTHFDANRMYSPLDVEIARVLPLYLTNLALETRYLDPAVVRSIARVGTRGAAPVSRYVRTHGSMPGICIDGCATIAQSRPADHLETVTPRSRNSPSRTE